jgi:hypothetical protein
MYLREVGQKGVDWRQLRIVVSNGSCEHSNEISGSIKSGEFLDQLSDYDPLKKDSTQWSSVS